MKRLPTMVCLVLCCFLAACSGDGGRSLYETAQFEEQQRNTDHAVKLYQEIVSKHPDSPYAAKATERLAQLGRR
jgi:outer membrane protein assembly factor BamD (BamD/ComL family)